MSDDVDRVIVWGGDGTVNEVAGPLIGTQTVLGIVPGGSGDGLAGGLKVPSDPHEAFALAASDTTLRLDIGWLGNRHFVNAAGIGFDAMVAYAFSQRRRRGFAGYVAAGFGSVASYRCATYTLNLDGATTTAPRFMVAFGNGREYGNGFVLAPDADPTDGYLDAVVVAEGSIVRQLWRARRLILAPGVAEPGIVRVRVRRAEISGPTDLMAHVDGEPFIAKSPVSIRVEPSALTVAVRSPAGAGSRR